MVIRLNFVWYDGPQIMKYAVYFLFTEMKDHFESKFSAGTSVSCV